MSYQDIDNFEYCVLNEDYEICGIFINEEDAKAFARTNPEYEFKDYCYKNIGKPDISFEV